jgi:hypothetical protein
MMNYTIKPIASQSFYKECTSVDHIKACVYAFLIDASNTDTYLL